MPDNSSADSGNKVLDLFNSIAAGYEVGTGGCTYDIARHIFQDICPTTSDSIVLDNACGTGIVSHHLLTSAALDGQNPPKLYCADFSPAMIQIARDTFTNIPNADSVTLDVMDGEALTYSACQVD